MTGKDYYPEGIDSAYQSLFNRNMKQDCEEEFLEEASLAIKKMHVKPAMVRHIPVQCPRVPEWVLCSTLLLLSMCYIG